MSAEPERLYTVDEYLEREELALEKSEYYRGRIYPLHGPHGMAVPSIRHNIITTNLVHRLMNRLSKPCRAFGSDLQIASSPSGLYTYPDTSIICGEAQVLDRRERVAANPVVIFEVLSPSTEAYDRGHKFELYWEIATLREYVLVSQHTAKVELFTRQADGTWNIRAAHGLEATLALASVNVELPLAEIYEDVRFDEPAGFLNRATV